MRFLPRQAKKLPESANQPLGDPASKTEMPIGEFAEISSIQFEPKGITKRNRYSPHILVGVGPTGEDVLRHWQKRISQEQNYDYSKIVMAAISSKPEQQEINSKFDGIQHFSLSRIRADHQTTAVSQRELRRKLFVEQCATGVMSFRVFLEACLQDLTHDITVVVVGSPTEEDFGVVPEVLNQIHSLKTFQTGTWKQVIGLFSIADSVSSEQKVEMGESYAAIREIGRLSFNAYHIFKKPSITDSDFQQIPLIDSIYLIDNSGGENKPLGPAADLIVINRISEALYVLTHPSSKVIWENQQNLVGETAMTRRRSQKTLVRTIGISTIEYPIAPLSSYYAIRLVMDVLFGEDNDNDNNALIFPQDDQEISTAEARSLMESWMKGGPNPHPLYGLLLDTEKLSTLPQLPSLHSSIERAFLAELYFGVMTTLNAKDKRNKLKLCSEGLGILKGHLEKLQKQLGSNNRDDLRQLNNLFLHWIDVIDNLLTQIYEWQMAVKPLAVSRASASHGMMQIGASAAQGDVHIADILARKLGLAEKQIIDQGESQVSFTAVQQDQLEQLFISYIRPDCFDPTLPPSQAYRELRRRVKWWISLDDNAQPTLVIAFCKSGERVLGRLPKEMLYTPTQQLELVDSMVDFTYQMLIFQNSEDNQYERWFKTVEEKAVKHLKQGIKPWLEYVPQPTDKQNNYIIAANPEIGAQYKELAFRFGPAIDIIPGNEPYRVTCMTIVSDILFSSVSQLQSWKIPHYLNSSSQPHILDPERQARKYEREIRLNQLDGPDGGELSPDVVATLVDPFRVTLFFQLWFSRMISINQNNQRGSYIWAVQGFSVDSRKYEEVKITDSSDEKVSIGSLWQAYQTFVISWMDPKPSLTMSQNSPIHLRNQDQYFRDLHASVKSSATWRNNTQRVARQRTSLCLDQLLIESKREPLYKSFGLIMEIEFRGPEYYGWN